MATWLRVLIAFLSGFSLSGITGIFVYKLNEIFHPEYAVPWRLLLWILAFGIMFTSCIFVSLLERWSKGI